MRIILFILLVSGSAYGQLYAPNGTVTATTNATTGNVGIGTSSAPAYKLEVSGNIVNSNPTNGWIGLTGDLPGYGNGIYGTLKTNANYLYFSAAGKYSAYMGGTDATLGLNDASANTKIFLNTNGNTYFNGGYVGIGLSNPQYTLDVNGAGNFYLLKTTRQGVTIDGSGFGNPWAIGKDNTNGLYFYEAGSVNQYRMIIKDGGNVGIGNTNPDAKLTVSGQVHAQEVKVTVSAPGPDYVFEKDYALPSLDQIKTYIEENKHLPEVPSAKEMEKNGVQLGEMNMLLLKKIEELTLYVIELKRENREQQKLIEKYLEKPLSK